MPPALPARVLTSTNHPPSPFTLITYAADLTPSSTNTTTNEHSQSHSHSHSHSPHNYGDTRQSQEEMVFRIAPQALWESMQNYHVFLLPTTDLENWNISGTNEDEEDDNEDDEDGHEDVSGDAKSKETQQMRNKATGEFTKETEAAARLWKKFSVHDNVLVPYTHRSFPCSGLHDDDVHGSGEDGAGIEKDPTPPPPPSPRRAHILEIRALNPQTVYLRVYWLPLTPDEYETGSVGLDGAVKKGGPWMEMGIVDAAEVLWPS